MRSLWKSSLALSLGLIVTGARAGETVWKAIPVQAGAEPAIPAQYAPPAPAPPVGRQVIATSGTASSTPSYPTAYGPSAAPAENQGVAAPQSNSDPPARDGSGIGVWTAPVSAPVTAPVQAAPVQAAPGASGVTLERPVPIASGGVAQSGIQPTSFSPTTPDPTGPIIRGQVSDPTPDPAASPRNYRHDDTPIGMPRVVPTPSTVAVPLGGGTLFATTPPGSPGVIVGTPGPPSAPLGATMVPGMVPGAPGALGVPVPLASPGVVSPPVLVSGPIASTPMAGCGGVCGGVSGQGGGVAPSGHGQGDGHDWFDTCDNCQFNNRWYASAEYLLWWMKGDPTPPLATTGRAQFLTDTNIGALGRSDTQVLFGGNSLGTGPNSGGRFNFGYWFFDDHALGVEVGGFFLGPNRTHFSASSNGSTELAIPFFDVNPNSAFQGESIQGVAGTRFIVPANSVTPVPGGVLAGNLDIVHQTSFWGAEVNVRTNCLCGPNGFLDFILGYREVGLDESLTLHESLNVVSSRIDPQTGLVAVPAGTTYEGVDKFSTSNRFYGVQIGLIGEKQWGPWSLGFTGKLGIGPTQELVDISGGHALQPPGVAPVGVTPGNLFTQPTNIGRYSRDVFSVLPEGSLTLGYQVTEHIRLTAGYNALYWSNVVRADQQIDRTVNSAQVNGQYGVGAARPTFNFNGSDFWAQGVSFGLQFRY